MSLGRVPHIWKYSECLYFQGHAVFMDCLSPKSNALHSLQMSGTTQPTTECYTPEAFMFEIPCNPSLLTAKQSAASLLQTTDINIISEWHFTLCFLP